MDPKILSEISKCTNVELNLKGQVVNRCIVCLTYNYELFSHAINYMVKLILNFIRMRGIDIHYVVSFDSHKFAQIAEKLGCRFMVIEKFRQQTNRVVFKFRALSILDDNEKYFWCIEDNIIPPGSNVLLIDDMITTGNKIWEACELIKMIGSNPIGCISLIQLVGLELCEKLSPEIKLLSLIKYQHDSKSREIDPIINHDLLVYVKEYYSTYF